MPGLILQPEIIEPENSENLAYNSHTVTQLSQDIFCKTEPIRDTTRISEELLVLRNNKEFFGFNVRRFHKL